MNLGETFISIQPNVSGFSWEIHNELRDIRWSTLVWLVGERYALELEDLDDAISRWQPELF